MIQPLQRNWRWFHEQREQRAHSTFLEFLLPCLYLHSLKVSREKESQERERCKMLSAELENACYDRKTKTFTKGDKSSLDELRISLISFFAHNHTHFLKKTDGVETRVNGANSTVTHCRRLCSGGRALEFQNVMWKSMLLTVANSFLPRCLARNLSSSEFLVSCHNSREYFRVNGNGRIVFTTDDYWF